MPTACARCGEKRGLMDAMTEDLAAEVYCCSECVREVQVEE
jgi:hypothetical protein